ncbi:tyrosine protein kinase, putative [Entamoeba invadens IP1]|uniref:Tyrosine protein kinase, putative n=1 Tax=Entamoeba invadens IP1 TaxID=370355 RepID=A0A0A1U0U4_ENTIV|nr:tyrosine protein kinase, putative [Entamoeba invadens IP1]ELP84508.1 tyrosine protein kinase, putative [Entamoeba invadens IP1]|eukprot:XP_004183854.1 tyrosine protein kinase, putative [Entamoeba invadens IP1]
MIKVEMGEHIQKKVLIGEAKTLPVTGLREFNMFMVNGLLYVFGGEIPLTQGATEYNKNVYSFSIPNARWTMDKFNSKSDEYDEETFAFSKSAGVTDGTFIYFVGGVSSKKNLTKIIKVNMETKEVFFIKIEGISDFGVENSVVLYNDKLYIIGFRTGNQTKSNSFVIIDMKTEKVVSTSELPFGVIFKHGSFVTTDGKIFVIGGKIGDEHNKDIFMYDAFSNKKSEWVTVAQLPIKLLSPNCVYMPDQKLGVILGGGEGFGLSNDKILLLDVVSKQLIENPEEIKITNKGGSICSKGKEIFVLGATEGLQFLSFDKEMNLAVLRKNNTKVIIGTTEFVLVSFEDKPEFDEKVLETLKLAGLDDNDALKQLLLENGYNSDDSFSVAKQEEFTDMKIDVVTAKKISRARLEVYNEDVKFDMSLFERFGYLTDVVPISALGQGAFGLVYKALWLGTTEVAMKGISGDPEDADPFGIPPPDGSAKKVEKDPTKPKKVISKEEQNAQLVDIAKEAFVSSKLKHPNLSTMYGIYKHHFEATGEDKLYMILALAKGDVLKLVKKVKKPFMDLLQVAEDIAAGMAYLGSLSIIHRDLALRNVLWYEDASGLRGRISDFGLSRVSESGEYQAKDDAKIPFKWTAPEALASKKFDVFNDIWAYGVTIWELFSGGNLPYSNLVGAPAVLDAVQSGVRLAKPDFLKNPFKREKEAGGYAPKPVVQEENDYGVEDDEAEKEEEEDPIGDLVYKIMLDTWNITPNKRPGFMEIYKRLEEVRAKSVAFLKSLGVNKPVEPPKEEEEQDAYE